MDYAVEIEKKAYSILKKFNKKQKAIFFKLIEKISHDPYKGKPLRYALKGRRSIHFGKYRIIYKISEEKRTIYVLEIEHRKKVYE